MSGITIREAVMDDLPHIIRIAAQDSLSSSHDEYSEPLDPRYVRAFRTIDGDPDNTLLVICLDGEVVGSLQLTFTPYLSYHGSWRATLENVRVAGEYRDRGLGTRLVGYAVELAREKGCAVVQLTSNKIRKDAHRFYERLCFEKSHEGMKLHLDE